MNSVRLGTALASNRKAAERWDRQMAARHRRSVGLTGAALENAVAALGATHPEYVVMG